MTMKWTRTDSRLGGKHVHGFVHPADSEYFIWAKKNGYDQSMRYILYIRGQRVGEAVDLESAKAAMEAHKAEQEKAHDHPA